MEIDGGVHFMFPPPHGILVEEGGAEEAAVVVEESAAINDPGICIHPPTDCYTTMPFHFIDFQSILINISPPYYLQGVPCVARPATGRWAIKHFLYCQTATFMYQSVGWLHTLCVGV